MTAYAKSEVSHEPYSVGSRLAKVEKQVEDLDRNFQDFRVNSIRTDAVVSERLDRLIKDGEDNKESLKDTNRKIDMLIESQNAKDSEKWNTVIKTLIGALVGGIVGYFLTVAGL